MNDIISNEGFTIDRQIPILSFFSGGGFLDMGFEQAGFEIVWTNEFNRDFAKMYEYGVSRWRKAVLNEPKPAKISTKRDLLHLYPPYDSFDSSTTSDAR